MYSPFSPKLTPRDFPILETILATQAMPGELLVAALRKKLNMAEIVFADDMPADVVTIGSRVVYGVNGGKPCECLIVMPEQVQHDAGCLAVTSLRGLGMLGLPVGGMVDIDCGSGREHLVVHDILAQPEAESRARRGTRHIRLVHNRDAVEQPAGPCALPCPAGPQDDDPGPTAA